jgi:hypothetical protein
MIKERKVRVSANRQSEFIPEFHGNKELPEKDQILVKVEFPTLEERETLKGYGFRDSGDISVNFNVHRILQNHVKEIKNLESEVNGKTVKITNGKMLAENRNPNLSPLIDEIKTYILKMDELTEEAEKNLESPSS